MGGYSSPPRFYPWKPARDIISVFEIFLPETFCQSGFFEQYKVTGIDEEEYHGPEEDRGGMYNERFADQDAQHPGDHRIARMGVDAGAYQSVRRTPRRERPPADPDEHRYRTDQQHQAAETDKDPRKQQDVDRNPPIGLDPYRNENEDCKRQNE